MTEELRKGLDECGVKWWEDSFDSKHRTLFDGVNGVRYCVYQLGDSLFIVSALPITTPAQAIAATVGVGACHITVKDNLDETYGLGDVWLECDECHWQMPLEPTTPRFSFCPNCGKRIEVDE